MATGARRLTRCTAPAASRRSDMAAPMPDEPPVTTATLPASSGKEDLDLVDRAPGQPLELRRPVLEWAQLAQGNRGFSGSQAVESLLEVSVGVPERSLDADVGPDDPVPGERRLVTVKAHEACRTGRSKQFNRSQPGRLGARCVDDQGGARLDLGELGDSRLGTQREGMLPAAG